MSKTRIPALAAAVALALGAAAGSAYAYNTFLTDWMNLYPTSRSAQAGCLLCHGASSKTMNSYGKSFCDATGGIVPKDITEYLRSIEGIDSDGEGSSNLLEIVSHAQPGWTSPYNRIYEIEACTLLGSSMTPPSDVPLPYDPPVAGEPVAIPGGPYTGVVGEPIVFDGTGSYDSDGGTIVSYAWDFGDGAAGTGAIAGHAYAAAGTYTVTLTTVDDQMKSNSHATTAAVSAAAWLDLDIAAFSVTSTVKVGKPVAIKLAVINGGPNIGQAFATVVGTMDGTEVYRWRQNVFDDPGKSSTSFAFPAYTPSAKGTVAWTATIEDGDSDNDVATAATLVK